MLARARRLAGVTVVLVCLGAAGSAAARPTRTTGMANDRYCEYLVVTGKLPNLVADVWNTYGLDDCPPALWRRSDANALKRQFGALAVQLNGPRHWLMDSASIELARGLGQVRSFNGLRMRRIATVQVPLTNGVPGAAPYTQVTVNRRNTFAWKRGRRVFELLAPDGSVYLMQAYAQIVDRAQTIATLPSLGARLKLPAGWRYRSRVLKAPLALTTTGRATVLQDELQDTYQLEHRG
ncbi:MAG TPA: hypothetical protein VII98_15775 [Solirubrobacteraceae bacterium]